MSRLARLGAHLRVALGDMDALDAERLHQRRPFAARLGVGFGPEVFGQTQKRGLDEPAHHAGVRPAAGHGGRPAGIGRLFVPHLLAQGIVGARRIILGIEVEARPRLDHGVDVEHAMFAAELHQVERRGIDRQVHDEALTILEQPAQHVLVVVRRQRFRDMGIARLPRRRPVRLSRLDDGQLVLVELEMTLDQGQGSLPDGAETDHDDGAVDAGVDGVGHGHSFDHGLVPRMANAGRGGKGRTR